MAAPRAVKLFLRLRLKVKKLSLPVSKVFGLRVVAAHRGNRKVGTLVISEDIKLWQVFLQGGLEELFHGIIDHLRFVLLLLHLQLIEEVIELFIADDKLISLLLAHGRRILHHHVNYFVVGCLDMHGFDFQLVIAVDRPCLSHHGWARCHAHLCW